ncbi:hypothetical protein Gotur_022585 [Gossypium turneri]
MGDMQILPGSRHRPPLKWPIWIISLVSLVCLVCAYIYPPQGSAACYVLSSRGCKVLTNWLPPSPTRELSDEEIASQAVIRDILSNPPVQSENRIHVLKSKFTSFREALGYVLPYSKASGYMKPICEPNSTFSLLFDSNKVIQAGHHSGNSDINLAYFDLILLLRWRWNSAVPFPLRCMHQDVSVYKILVIFFQDVINSVYLLNVRSFFWQGHEGKFSVYVHASKGKPVHVSRYFLNQKENF